MIKDFVSPWHHSYRLGCFQLSLTAGELSDTVPEWLRHSNEEIRVESIFKRPQTTPYAETLLVNWSVACLPPNLFGIVRG